jgi:hypothetical protein
MLATHTERIALIVQLASEDAKDKLVRIDTGKANRAPPDAATWIKLESQIPSRQQGPQES